MSNKIYCINNSFKKYIKYIQSNCSCNLTISSISIKQIYKEQIHLKKEVYNTRAKLNRLKKQLDFLKNKKKEIIVTKQKNINNLKINKIYFAKFVTKISELLFNILFEQF